MLKKHFIQENCIIATETKTSSFLGSVIIAKKRIRVKEVRLIISRNHRNGQKLEMIGVKLEKPIVGNFWIKMFTVHPIKT